MAVLELVGGSTSQVRILHGDEPFIEPTRTALRQWRFPADRGDAPALVVVNFRDPYLTMTGTKDGILLGPQERIIEAKRTLYNGPLPSLVVDPLYGHSMTVMGASVLHLQVSTKGTVDKVEIVRELGDLTTATVEAVKKWKFLPATDRDGKAVPTEAFAVCVYRPLENAHRSW